MSTVEYIPIIATCKFRVGYCVHCKAPWKCCYNWNIGKKSKNEERGKETRSSFPIIRSSKRSVPSRFIDASDNENDHHETTCRNIICSESTTESVIDDSDS